MRIEKYNAVQLKEFLNSDQYRTMPFVPVSESRAQSWLNNPRLAPGDILMNVAYENKEMLAYRCVLPDRHAEIRFGWLSGVWVRPDQRRRGLASMLFDEAFSDWGGQLMFTNYAPESLAVYDKSGRFDLYMEKTGIRYYQRSSTASLLGSRSTMFRRSRPLLGLADGVLNTIQDIRIRVRKENINDLVIEEAGSPDLEATAYLEKYGGTGFCNRSEVEFDWIASYPWVKSGKDRDSNYFFTSISPRFQNICIKIKDSAGDMQGFLWIVINGEKMTLPYTVFNRGKSADIFRVINHFMQAFRVSYMTAYNSTITNSFQPGPLLTSRNMIQRYYVTHELARQLPAPRSVNFQDGDGDVIFV